MNCVKCGTSVMVRPLFRSTKAGPLPYGKWACGPCGGQPRNAEVRRLVDVISGAPIPEAPAPGHPDPAATKE
jgi:hypothetical protein